MDKEQLVQQIYDHVDADRVESALMGCLRLSRSIKDHLNMATFLWELLYKRQDVVRALHPDVSDLTVETQTFLLKTSHQRWLDLHTLDFALSPDKPDHNIFCITAGELDPELQQWERTIAETVVPPNMDPYDTAAFTDSYNEKKANFRLRVKALQTIKVRLKARCLDYASQVERQLDLQRKNQGFLDLVQNEVNNFFKARSNDVYVKLQKAAELAVTPDLEDAALLLTEVRRALKVAADFFYAPVPGKTLCADGKERDLGEEKHLNRLQEFLAQRLKSSTSKELLQAELEALGKFLDRLNNLASKGVHASVALAEAKQGLVGLYFFLFNLSQQLLQNADSCGTHPELIQTEPPSS
jgi:hypothetical protein